MQVWDWDTTSYPRGIANNSKTIRLARQPRESNKNKSSFVFRYKGANYYFFTAPPQSSFDRIVVRISKNHVEDVVKIYGGSESAKPNADEILEFFILAMKQLIEKEQFSSYAMEKYRSPNFQIDVEIET